MMQEDIKKVGEQKEKKERNSKRSNSLVNLKQKQVVNNYMDNDQQKKEDEQMDDQKLINFDKVTEQIDKKYKNNFIFQNEKVDHSELGQDEQKSRQLNPQLQIRHQNNKALFKELQDNARQQHKLENLKREIIKYEIIESVEKNKENEFYEQLLKDKKQALKDEIKYERQVRKKKCYDIDQKVKEVQVKEYLDRKRQGMDGSDSEDEVTNEIGRSKVLLKSGIKNDNRISHFSQQNNSQLNHQFNFQNNQSSNTELNKFQQSIILENSELEDKDCRSILRKNSTQQIIENSIQSPYNRKGSKLGESSIKSGMKGEIAQKYYQQLKASKNERKKNKEWEMQIMSLAEMNIQQKQEEKQNYDRQQSRDKRIEIYEKHYRNYNMKRQSTLNKIYMKSSQYKRQQKKRKMFITHIENVTKQALFIFNQQLIILMMRRIVQTYEKINREEMLRLVAISKITQFMKQKFIQIRIKKKKKILIKYLMTLWNVVRFIISMKKRIVRNNQQFKKLKVWLIKNRIKNRLRNDVQYVQMQAFKIQLMFRYIVKLQQSQIQYVCKVFDSYIVSKYFNEDYYKQNQSQQVNKVCGTQSFSQKIKCMSQESILKQLQKIESQICMIPFRIYCDSQWILFKKDKYEKKNIIKMIQHDSIIDKSVFPYSTHKMIINLPNQYRIKVHSKESADDALLKQMNWKEYQVKKNIIKEYICIQKTEFIRSNAEYHQKLVNFIINNRNLINLQRTKIMLQTKTSDLKQIFKEEEEQDLQDQMKNQKPDPLLVKDHLPFYRNIYKIAQKMTNQGAPVRKQFGLEMKEEQLELMLSQIYQQTKMKIQSHN